MLVRRDLPQLFQADAILLVIAFLIECKPRNELFRERAARPFTEQDIFPDELHAAHIGVLLPATARNAHIAGRHATHRAVIVVKDFACREAGINLDTERLGLLGQPAAEVSETCDVVAVVVHERRHQKVGQPDRPSFP